MVSPIDRAIDCVLGLDKSHKEFILQDLPRWQQLARRQDQEPDHFFREAFSNRQEFRSVIRYRVDRFGFEGGQHDVMNLYNVATANFPSYGYISNFYLSCLDVGPGLYLEHAFSTIVFAQKIGKNFWLNQNVTIGTGRNGYPTIGDNVSVRTHAVIVGGIHIGNDVKIGAGAVVIDSIPDGATVVPQKSRVILRS